MNEVGSAAVTIIPSARGFGRALERETASGADGAGRRGGGIFGTAFARTSMGPIRTGIGGVGKAFVGLAAGVGALNVFKGFIADGRESIRIGKLTEQVIKTTGGAAGITAVQVGNLATAISNKTGIDDEAIQSASNLLLTFTNVRNEVGKGNDIFNQATATAVDMAAVLGGDAASQSIALGKALNDPVKGVTALSRVGVSFTQQQKDQIATMVASGNTLGAQKVIMAELGKEFGGAAQAAATPMDRLKVTLGNLGETVGTRLIPFLDRGAVILATKVIPALGTAAGFVQRNATAFKIFGGVLAGLVAITAAHSLVVAINTGALKAWVVGTKIVTGVTKAWAAVQWLLNVAMTANPIGLVVLAIAALVAGFIIAYKKSETFRNIVNGVFSIMKTHITTTLNVIRTVVTAVWGFISAYIGAQISLIRAVVGKVTSVINTIRAGFTALKATVVSTIGGVVTTIAGLPGKAMSALRGLGTALVGVGKDIVRGLIRGISSLKDAVSGALLGLLPGPLKKFAGKLGISSPSKLFYYYGRMLPAGLVGGVDRGEAAAVGRVGLMADRLARAGASGMAPIGYGATGTTAALPGAAGVPSFRVFIGARELTDIVRVEIDDRDDETARTLASGRRAF